MTHFTPPDDSAALSSFSQFEERMRRLQDISDSIGKNLVRGLREAVLHGASLKRIFSEIWQILSRKILDSTLTQLGQGLKQSFKNSDLDGSGSAMGRLFQALPFAQGGVVRSPTYFAMEHGHQMGVAGEAGAEAILPLSRGPNGRLGVRLQGDAAPLPPPPITVQIIARDIESFRHSEHQITAVLARAVGRGIRSL